MAGDSGLPETYDLEGGGNFGVWSYRMKNMLQKEGRFHVCLTPPSKIMGEEEKTQRQQVMNIINSNAKNNALKLLRRYNDPYECWTGLKTRYESDSGPRRVMLIEKFFSLRKTESVSMDAHLTEVKEIANLLEEVEVNIPEDIIVYYTLKNLPKEYDIFKRMQIAAQKLPTYEQLEAKLISEETSIKLETQQLEEGEAFFLRRDRNTGRRPPPPARNGQFASNPRSYRRQPDSAGSSTPKVYASPDSGGVSAPRSPNRNSNFDSTYKGTSNAATYQPRFRSRATDRQRSSQCNFCGIDGHFERECDLRSLLDRIKDYEHRLLERRQRSLGGQINHLEESTEILEPHSEDLSADQVVDACLMELNLIESPPENSAWYLDSGATHHVSGNPASFSSVRSISGAQVRSAGGHSHSVTGVGDVDFQMLSGEIKSIPHVLYTPGITKNLLSVGSLTDKRKTLVFKSQGCFIVDDVTQKVEAFAVRERDKGLYRLQTRTIPKILTAEAYSLKLRSQADLWHQRLGHFHTRGIQRMLASNAVTGLPQLHFPSTHSCTSCHLGKQARTKMPKTTTHRASEILELVHSDVCGPFKIPSTGGARYFVTFVDDFSRKLWIFSYPRKAKYLTSFDISSSSCGLLPARPSNLSGLITEASTPREHSLTSALPTASNENLSHPIHQNVMASQKDAIGPFSTLQGAFFWIKLFLVTYGEKL